MPAHTPVSLSELRTAMKVLAAGWSPAAVPAITPNIRTTVLNAIPSLRILTPPRVELIRLTYAPAHLSDQISPSHLVAWRQDQRNPRYARKRARLDPRSANLRHRHQHPLLVDRDLLFPRDESVRVLLPRPVPTMVASENLRCLRGQRAAVFCFSRRSRARAFARRTPFSDDRFVDHALHAWRGGQLFAGLVFAFAVAFVFGIVVPQSEVQGILYGFIGYFLWNAASSSLQQERLASVVGGAKVAPLMTTDFRSTSPGVMVGQVIRDLVLPMNLRAIPVVSGDRLIGLITIGDLRKVEQDRWAMTPVDQVMTPESELATVSPDDALGTALERFGATDLPLLPVVKDGRLVGVLYREAVIGYVRMQEMVAPQGRR